MLFNEKVSCGLGRGIAPTGRMDEDAVDKAVGALKRYRALAEQAGVETMHVLATAAAREASNGPDFVAKAEAILGKSGSIELSDQDAIMPTVPSIWRGSATRCS